MNTIKPITKAIVKAHLFQEIADASQETDCPFTAEQIEYFFENVFANLDDDEGFYRHYDAAMQMSDKDFEACFWDHHNMHSNFGTYDVLGAMSCISYDTKLFHIDDLADCKELSENFPEREAMQAMLLSNLDPKHKVELFNELGEKYDIQKHGDYDTIKENVISYEYRHRSMIRPDFFLMEYDGVIAKALLKRDYEQRYQLKDTKTKTRKI